MKYTLIIAVFSLFFVSCNNTQQKKDNNKKQKQGSELQEFAKKVASINNDISNEEAIVTLFNMSGASFMPNLVNNPHNVDKYKTSKYVAAANLGIYNTDILYQAAYQQSEGTMLSYNAAKYLAYFIGLGEVYDEVILKRIEDGITPDDSIGYILHQNLKESGSLLSEKEEAKLYTSILIGSNIEKLYILNNIIFNYTEDIPDEAKLQILRKTVITLESQIKYFINYTDLFKEYSYESEKAAKTYKRLKELKDIYSSFNLAENIQTVEPKQLFENKKLIDGFNKVKEMRQILIENNQQ
jgi:hypothetical protein